MKCLILAAGYATRLYPLTENFPKPLLQVQGKTILDWLLEDIAGAGVVDEYIVISNSRFAGHFRDWAGNHILPIRVVDDGTESNETRLGAVRDIQFAIESLGLKDDLMVIAGDNLLNFSLKGFIEFFKEKGSSVIMRYFEPEADKLRRSGVVVLGENDRVVEMQEKPEEPKSSWCCPPFYIYSAADVALVKKGIEAGCGVDAPGSFISWLVGQTVVHAYEMPGKRYDIGNLESYKRVQEEYKGIE